LLYWRLVKDLAGVEEYLWFIGGVEWAHSSIELGDFVNRIGRWLEKASHIM